VDTAPVGSAVLHAGYGWYPAAVLTAYSMGASDELNMLKADTDTMQKSLDTINKRIKELEKKSSESS